MLLVIDVGNTQTVIGVYQGEELICSERISTNRSATTDELRAIILPLFKADGIESPSVRQAILASVVPQLVPTWEHAIEKLFGVELLLCNAQTAGSLFTSRYPHPNEIGADRIADAVAAKQLYDAPVIVVDFGTATNIEVIDEDGMFLGGVIMPGLQTSADALTRSGSLLPAIALKTPRYVIGDNTQEALRSGIVYGQAAATDGLVHRICAQIGKSLSEVTVVATGGLGTLVASHCSTISTVNKDLTLIGLHMIAQAHYNQDTSK